MARLVAQGGHRRDLLKTLNLIGSEPTADIPVRADWGLAPRHCQIGRSAAGWLLEPLAGPGNTLLNGSPIGAITLLQHGDRITAGQLDLTFEDAAAASRSSTEPAAPDPAADGGAARRAWKIPGGALRSILALAVLTVTALAAWALGAFERGNVATPESAGRGVSAIPADEHHSLLAQFAPPRSSVIGSVNMKGVAEFYGRLHEAAGGALPAIDSLRSALRRSAGFDVLSVERWSFIGAPAESSAAIVMPPRDGLNVLSFESDSDMREALAAACGESPPIAVAPGIDLYRPEAGSWAGDGLFMRPVHGGHLLVGAAESLRHDPPRSDDARIENLRGRAATILFSASGAAGRSAPARVLLGRGPKPRRVDIEVDLDLGASVAAAMEFGNPRAATRAMELLDNNLRRRTARSGTPEGGLLDDVLALLAGAAERAARENEVLINASTNKAGLRVLGRTIRAELEAEAEREAAVRDARTLAGVHGTALEAGSAELRAAPDARIAAQRIARGVRGGGGFSETLFRAEQVPPERLEAALAHLGWVAERNALVLREQPPALSPAALLAGRLIESATE